MYKSYPLQHPFQKKKHFNEKQIMHCITMYGCIPSCTACAPLELPSEMQLQPLWQPLIGAAGPQSDWHRPPSCGRLPSTLFRYPATPCSSHPHFLQPLPKFAGARNSICMSYVKHNIMIKIIVELNWIQIKQHISFRGFWLVRPDSKQ